MKINPEVAARFPRPGTAVPGKTAFTPDGRCLTFLWSERGDLARQLWEMDLATGERRILFSGATEETFSREETLRRERQRLRETGITHYAWAADANVLLVPLRGDAVVDGKTVARDVTEAQLSHDGKILAWVSGNEVWASGRQLTFDAQPGVTNGLADYCAQEEMHRFTGLWISRDGKHVAFEQADERHIPIYPIMHQGKDALEIEEHRYPFAGAANPQVRLGVVAVAGGAVTWMDLGGFEYLARVAWAPDGRLFVQLQSRDQRRLELRAYDAATGTGRTLVTEESKFWVNLHDDLRVLDSGEHVWASERSGFKHLYLYRDDKIVRQLTSGDWPIDAVLRATRTHVWYASGGGNPVERQIWRVPLSGGAPERISKEPGWHDAVVARDGTSWVDLWESRTQPPRITLREVDGRVRHIIHETPEAIDLPAPEIVSFPSRDGATLYGMIYKPEKTPAPLIVAVYGGPHVQTVQDTWLGTVDMRAQYLAQQGFVVLKVDNRGSARRGLAFEGTIAENMGDIEVRDQVDGVRYAQKLGLVDGDRVGLYGWSYGGYMTLMGLCRAPEVFKAGVAGAPVTHWDGYDTHYTERYMRTPQSNPEGYKRSAVMTHVENLRGKLLVIHGMLDENVHFRHTARLLHALLEANKPHEQLTYPEERHMPRSEKGRAAMEARVCEFFLKSL